MSLLRNIKDQIVQATSRETWDVIAKDFTDELVAYLVGSDISVFTDALEKSKEIYGLKSVEVSNIKSAGNDSSVSLNVTKSNLYDTRDIWAEESGGANANSAEWSYGNGAVGFMGIPVGTGWEVVSMYFHADTYAATAKIQVDLMNYGNTPSNAAANTICSISLSSSKDGGGATNNAYKIVEFDAPVPVPATGGSTVLGFITRGLSGSVSDMRVGVNLRRKTGEYVSDVTLS